MRAKLLIVPLVLLFGIIVATAILVKLGNKPPEPNKQKQHTATAPVTDSPPVITFTAEANKTVLDQLTSYAAVETQLLEDGVFISSISGVQSGQGGRYWAYYIDNQTTNVNAAEYVTKGGEKVEWRLE